MTTSHAVELKLATRRISESTTSCSASQRRDGQLMLVSPDARHWVPAQAAASMQQLLDGWEQLAPVLQAQYQALDAAQWQGAIGCRTIQRKIGDLGYSRFAAAVPLSTAPSRVAG